MIANDTPASGMVGLADATLRHVMETGLLDGPRVSAARAVIELAKQEQGKAPRGKKAEAAAAAARAESEFKEIFK